MSSDNNFYPGVRPSEALAALGKPIAYYPHLAKSLGGVTATVFFCQLFYWWSKGRSNDLGIYKTADEWEEETGLSVQEQRTARKKLKAIGVLEEVNKRLEHRIYYALNLDAFDALFAKSNSNSPEMQNQHSGGNESTVDELQNQHSLIQENTKRLLQENTTDINKIDSAFEIFWLAGMKKTNKPTARRSFEKVFKEWVPVDGTEKIYSNFGDFLAKDIQQRLAVNKASKGKLMFGFDSLHPSTYLNNQRWLDELPESPSTAVSRMGAEDGDYSAPDWMVKRDQRNAQGGSQ